jgi:hypothetical protein
VQLVTPDVRHFAIECIYTALLPQRADDDAKCRSKLVSITINPETYYSADEVAEMRGVTKKTLEAERSLGGGIAYSRIGKRVFYLGKVISDYVGKSQRPIAPSTLDRVQGPSARPSRPRHERISRRYQHRAGR